MCAPTTPTSSVRGRRLCTIPQRALTMALPTRVEMAPRYRNRRSSGIEAMTRDEIETPALILDLDLMEANLERMAAFFRSVPAKLRPHFKNHKCPDLAWRQLDAGAIGITCATMREAECLVHHGIRNILLANEIVDSAKIRRFVDLARRADVILC